MILLIFVSTVCAVSTDIREIVIDTSLIVFQESNWNYFKVKPTSDEIFYLSVRVRIDLKNQVLLAISNDGYPTINSGVIQAD